MPRVNTILCFLGEVLPKSKIGEAVGYAASQWPTLVRYLQDGRLMIDNATAEQAIRPLPFSSLP
jgi:hypothetical protein